MASADSHCVETSSMTDTVVRGYIRVSSIEQKSGFGPTTQCEAIKDYCKAKGWEITDNDIVNEAMSGKSTDRAGIAKLKEELLSLAEDGAEVHLVFYRLDRLARNLTDSELFIRDMRKSGIELHCCQQTEQNLLEEDEEGGYDPMREIFRKMLGLFYEMELMLIKKRLLSGRKAKSRQGGFSGGRVTYGYKTRKVVRDGNRFDTELIVDEEKAETIRCVFEAHGKGVPMRTIGVQLDANPKYRNLITWTEATVARIIAREEMYRSGKYQDRMGGIIARSDLIILK